MASGSLTQSSSRCEGHPTWGRDTRLWFRIWCLPYSFLFPRKMSQGCRRVAERQKEMCTAHADMIIYSNEPAWSTPQLFYSIRFGRLSLIELLCCFVDLAARSAKTDLTPCWHLLLHFLCLPWTMIFIFLWLAGESSRKDEASEHLCRCFPELSHQANNKYFPCE